MKALLTAGLHGEATSINENGGIAGWVYDAAYHKKAFYTPSASTQVTFIPRLWGETNCMATDVNDYGVVVGFCGYRSFKWGARTGLKELARPSGTYSVEARSINKAGDVVGRARASVAPYDRAIKWDRNGLYTFLNTPGESSATVNDEWGRIAGSAQIAKGTAFPSLLAMWTSGPQGPTTYFAGEKWTATDATWVVSGGYLLVGGQRACQGGVGCVGLALYANGVSGKGKIVGADPATGGAAYMTGISGAVHHLPAPYGYSAAARVNTCGTIVGVVMSTGYSTPVVWAKPTCD